MVGLCRENLLVGRERRLEIALPGQSIGLVVEVFGTRKFSVAFGSGREITRAVKGSGSPVGGVEKFGGLGFAIFLECDRSLLVSTRPKVVPEGSLARCWRAQNQRHKQHQKPAPTKSQWRQKQRDQNQPDAGILPDLQRELRVLLAEAVGDRIGQNGFDVEAVSSGLCKLPTASGDDLAQPCFVLAESDRGDTKPGRARRASGLGIGGKCVGSVG